MGRSLLAGILIAALTACSSSNLMKARPTPSDPLVALYRVKFMKSCLTSTTSAMSNYCECTEDALEAKYTIVQLEALMKDRVLRDSFMDIRRACAKGAGLELRKSS